jgi:hypothetical protein
MFKEFKYIKEGGVAIIDSDFQELIVVQNDIYYGYSYYIEILIECYERRKLAVAKNIFLYFKSNVEIFREGIQDQITLALQFSKNYPKYHDEVEKYLSLI